MAKVTVKLNNAGVMELFKSKEMQDYLQEVAEEVAARASEMSGETYDANTKVLSKTAVGYVTARGYKAQKDALENNTMLKAVGAAQLPTHKPDGEGLTKKLESLIEEEMGN